MREEVNAKWVVDVKGEANQKIFEISVLRDNNILGKDSYGWFSEDKILITYSGGPCHWPLTKQVWEKCVKVAHEVAEELNAIESEASQCTPSCQEPESE